MNAPNAPNPELKAAYKEVPQLLTDVDNHLFNNARRESLRQKYNSLMSRFGSELDKEEFLLISQILDETRRLFEYYDALPAEPQEAGGRYIQPINHKPSEKYCCGAGTPPNILYKPF